MKPRVINLAKIPVISIEQLRERFVLEEIGTTHPDAAMLRAVARGARALIPAGESVISKELIAELPDLELIAVFGVGYDGVDVTFARSRGLQISHTPYILTDDVAALALGLLLARHVHDELPAIEREPLQVPGGNHLVHLHGAGNP